MPRGQFLKSILRMVLNPGQDVCQISLWIVAMELVVQMNPGHWPTTYPTTDDGACHPLRKPEPYVGSDERDGGTLMVVARNSPCSG